MTTIISVILNPVRFPDNPFTFDQLIELKKEMGRSKLGTESFIVSISDRPEMNFSTVQFLRRYFELCGAYETGLKLIINTTPAFTPALMHGTTTISFADDFMLTTKDFDLVNIHIDRDAIVYEFVENIQLS